MNGWFTVAIILISLLAIALILMRLSTSRWWHYIAMLVLAVPLCRPVVRNVMGDISRYTPRGAFDEGADGKDQIIIASAGSTVLLALISSAVIVGALLYGWRAVRNKT